MTGATIIIGIIFFVAYFAPTIISESRGRDGSGWIFMLNLFLGWTVLGWIVLLIVAFTGRSKRDREQQDEQIRLMRTMVAQQSLSAEAAGQPLAVPVAPPHRPASAITPEPAIEPAPSEKTLAELMAEKESQ